MVHDGVNQYLQLLDPALSKALMLVVRLTLPIINAVSMQDFLDLNANFDFLLSLMSLVWASHVVQIWSLSVLMNCKTINSSCQRLHTNKTWAMVAPESTAGVSKYMVSVASGSSPLWTLRAGKRDLYHFFRRVLMGKKHIEWSLIKYS